MKPGGPDSSSGAAPDAGKALFISYAREDRPFVETLSLALRAADREPWVDLEYIPKTASWLEEVYAGIESAGSVLFVISPDSVRSEACARELVHALQHRKRLIPILRRDVDAQLVPSPLAALNWLFFRDSDPFDRELAALLEALAADLEWVRAHTRLLTHAIEWESKGRNASFVLHGDELREAEQWLAEIGPEREPQPTPLQRQYVLASRTAATRQQRFTLGGVTLALGVSIALGLFASVQCNEAVFQQRVAVEARATAVTEAAVRATAEANARSEANVRATAEAIAETRRQEAERQARLALSRQLATQALNELNEAPDLALLLSVEATGVEKTAEARTSLFSSLGSSSRLAAFLHGHQNSVSSLAFTRDGKTLATGDASGFVLLWDAAARKPLHPPVEASQGQLFTLAFSPDGALLAAGGKFGDLTFWDVGTGRSVGNVTADTGGWVTSVSFSPDGKTLASASLSGSIFLWDVATRQLQAELSGAHAGQANAVAFSPDGKALASAGQGQQDNIVIWDVAARQPLGPRFSQPDIVWEVAFSPDGNFLISNGEDPPAVGEAYDRTTLVWSVATGRLPNNPVLSIAQSASAAFSPDGKSIASAGRSGIALWDVATGKPRSSLPYPPGTRHVAFSPDGSTLASSAAERVVLWDVSTELPLGRRLQGHVNEVCGVAYSYDGTRLASASGDGQIRLWDTATGQTTGPPLNRGGGASAALAFSPDAEMLAAAEPAGIVLWNLATSRSSDRPLPHPGAASLRFSDANTLVSASLDRTVVWDLTGERSVGTPLTLGRLPADRNPAATPSCDRNPYNTVELGADGRLVAEGGVLQGEGPQGSSVVLHDLTTRDRVRLDSDSYAPTVAVSPDGRLVAAGGHQFGNWPVAVYQSYIWDLAGRQLLVPPLRHASPVSSLSFSPDASLLATGDHDGSISLWDVTTGQRLGPSLSGGPDAVQNLRFSPNGSLLVSTSGAGALTLWDVSLASWQARACRIANRNLTRSEWNQFIGSEVGYRTTCSDQPAVGSAPRLRDLGGQLKGA